MLKLILHKNNYFKTIFYGFEIRKIINLSFLFLLILFFIGWYITDNLNKSHMINKVKISNQFFINNGFRIENQCYKNR